MTINGRQYVSGDEVEWMFINAGLGIFGIVSQIDWILSLFGKHVGDFPPYAHVVPLLYFVLYTFLIRHAFLDIFSAREDEAKRRRVEYGYVVSMLAAFSISHLLGA
jgi:archaellum biogenesis protein FlaJ (TadC family)